ncbi:MAG: IMP dehydrogenase [Oligosphaeraceae bacterium]
MVNEYIAQFMESFPHEALTFNDVSMEVYYADFLPGEARTNSQFSRNISLNLPFISAAMDTVTEHRMAIAMAKLGGLGVIHKNLPPARQAAEAAAVKHYLNGVIERPVTFQKGQKVYEIIAERSSKDYKFSGFPILDEEGRLCGLFTHRDLKFITDYNVPVESVMTTRLITAPKGTDMTRALALMMEHKVGKLPLVDDQGRLAGLYSLQDVRTLLDKMEPNYNRDAQHRLRVAAAVGIYEEERIEALVRAGTDALIVDSAHGHSKNVMETVREIKRQYPQVDVVAGNVCTTEGARAMLECGADAVKVGIGPGSICTTRVVAGVGIPQLTAIYNAYKGVGDEIPIIADGGIAHSGDVAKALAVGARSVMMGSALAGTEECPGERILHQGRTYVIYRGMGSLDAMRHGKGSRERYGVSAETAESRLVPQGIEGMIPFRGSVGDVVNQYAGGLRFSLGYLGARTIPELQDHARFWRVSAAGLQEAHPHNVIMQKDAPNYSAS